MLRARHVGTRAIKAPSLGFALLFAAATLSATAPVARVLGRAGLGGRAAALFICFASGASSPSGALPGWPDPKHDRGSACAYCAACSSGDAPLIGRAGLVDAAPVRAFLLIRTVADRAAPTPRLALSYRSRAPPVDVA